MVQVASQEMGRSGGGSSSLLRQVGNFLGFTRFSRQAEPQPAQSDNNDLADGERSGQREMPDAGLAGLL